MSPSVGCWLPVVCFLLRVSPMRTLSQAAHLDVKCLPLALRRCNPAFYALPSKMRGIYHIKRMFGSCAMAHCLAFRSDCMKRVFQPTVHIPLGNNYDRYDSAAQCMTISDNQPSRKSKQL